MSIFGVTKDRCRDIHWNTFQINTTCKPIRSWNIHSLLQNSWLNYWDHMTHALRSIISSSNVTMSACKVRNKPGRSGWLWLYSGCLFYYIRNDKGLQLEKIKMLRSITWKCGIVPMHLPSLPPSPYGGSLWHTSYIFPVSLIDNGQHCIKYTYHKFIVYWPDCNLGNTYSYR